MLKDRIGQGFLCSCRAGLQLPLPHTRLLIAEQAHRPCVLTLSSFPPLLSPQYLFSHTGPGSQSGFGETPNTVGEKAPVGLII